MIKKWIIALIVALTMAVSNVSAVSYTIKGKNVYRKKTATFIINKIAKGDYVTVKAGSKSYKKTFSKKKTSYAYKVKMPSSGKQVTVIHYNKSKKQLIKKTFKLKAKPVMVYVTMYGEKYHRKTCPCIKNRKTAKLSKSAAKSYNYTACKVCKP